MAASTSFTAASTMEIDEFINGALVSWLESCLTRPEILTGYSSLLDGHIIHSVWLQIDPEPQNNPLEITEHSGLALNIGRSKNFNYIVRNLKTLYEEEFGQTLLSLPDCYVIGYHAETKQGLEQMKLLLTLLLGAAVQCPNKQLFIGRIKELNVEIQHAIVELIKQVTDNHSLVLKAESLELLPANAMYNHILRLTKERDNIYLKWIQSVCAETEANVSQCDGNTSNLALSPSRNGLTSSTPNTSASNADNNHMAVELADLKSRLRKLRQELEEKSEGQLELREELEYKSTQYEKLRLESQEWYSEAKRASAYRDEVDVLRERAERADRLEIELQKFKEKLTDSEFYKTRVEELREDNRMLLESKEMLEEQLQRWRKRSDHVMTLESEIIKYKQKLNDMALERDADRSRLEELIEENTQLQLVAKNLNSTMDMDKSFSDNEDECNSGDNSLSEQLTNNAQSRALKLEIENRRLTAALDQLKESSFHESTNKILELEKDKKKLSLKLEQMQDNIQRLSQQNTELENVFKNALEENKKMQDTLDQRQKAYDKQSSEREVERVKICDLEKHVEQLTKEKQRIHTLNESVQRRADDLERMMDARTKEIDQHVEKLKQQEKTKETLYELEMKLQTCERENASLAKEVCKLKENLEEKSVVLDEKCVQQESQSKEILRLVKQLEVAEQTQLRVNDLEQQNQELITQREIDTQTIETLRNDLVNGTLATNKVRNNLEKLGLNIDVTSNNEASAEEPAEFNVEFVVEKLVRNPETFKTVRQIMLNVSKEYQSNFEKPNSKADICILCHRKEVFTVEKNIELSPSSASLLCHEPRSLSFEHTVHLSPPSSRVSAELSKLSEANTQLNALNAALQSNNDQIQAENARFKVDVATLGSQITSLNTQHVALQLANSQLAADKDVLLKENETLKQEHKNLLHDQVTLQCLHDQLSAEYESLNKGREQLKAVIRDLRNESRELREHIVSLETQIEDLKHQNTSMKSCAEDLAILRTEHSKLTDDFRSLFATSDRFKNEYKNIQEQYKMIRMENSKLKLQNTDLSGELGTRNDQMKIVEIQYAKSTQRCEMLMQQNVDLDMERKTLMENVSHLLKQYHELLTLSLEDKKHFHEEEKSYTECVHNLNRQKEKLEEKIMELFKKSEQVQPKKKPFASNLVRRVKKASSDFMNKVPSRNRRSWIDDSRLTQSQFMIGSESGGNDSDNSTEEPVSINSDSHLIQRNVPIRQSLQREVLDNSLSRGGTMRSSLQTHKRTDLNNSRRNSVHGLEAPDVTGSSLTLGTAGSRRTVYLIDENQKIPETNQAQQQANHNTKMTASSSSSSPSPGNNNLSNNNNIAEPQTPVSVKSSASSSSAAAAASDPNSTPSTILMYNRINNIIGGTNSLNLSHSLDSPSGSGGNRSDHGSEDGKLLRKSNAQPQTQQRTEDKSNSIWYEYGCV